MCFWRCSGIAYVRDGKLWKFEGNPKDPQSRGRLCPRGTGAVGTHYDPDRLQKPLIRRGERGKEEWTAVTWDEAFVHIADRMQKIKAQHGPEAVAAITHGIGQRFFQHVLKSWGAINFAGPSYAQCRGPRDVGFTLTFGAGLGSPEPTDIENTDCLVLIGSHLGENMHNSQVQEFARAVERRIPIIVVDPRFSVAASKAKYWLPIKPGTDLALLLAWMNVLVSEGRYDHGFVEKHGHGFDKFAAEIRAYTPEWAAVETGIDATLIRTTAREFASHRPATIVHPGRRVIWNGDDTQRSRAIALLSALLGNWGRKGGLYLSAGMKIAPYPLPPYPKSDKPKADGSDGARYPFADEGITTSIRDATLTGKPYPIKGWFVYSSNILYALPNTSETLQGNRQSRSAGGRRHGGQRDRRLRRRRPAGVHVSRTPRRAAGRLGPHRVDIAAPAGRRRAARAEAGLVDRERAREQARHRRVHAVQGYRGVPRLSHRALRLPLGGHQARRRDHGRRAADHGRGRARARRSTRRRRRSSSGPISLRKAGFDPVPKYKAPATAPEGHFRLITGRAPVHTFSRTQTNPLLHDLMPENEVWVNGKTAATAGLKSGDYVKLRNQDGVISNRVRVKATQRIRPDCVYLVYGFGHTSKMLKSAYLKGANAAQLTTKYVTDPLMGGTSIHSNFVTFVKEA